MPRQPLAAVAALLLSLHSLAAARQQPADALSATPSPDLLARAAHYVSRFEGSMSTVVVEERYVQIIKRWTSPPKGPDAAHLSWLEDLSSAPVDVIVLQRRQTKSDVLLVQLPNEQWYAFRDTFEVNGREQGHREDRLRRLFLEQTEDSRRQLRRINEQSADWNLGGFYREINLPTTGLLILHSRNQPRFRFVPEAIERVGASTCRVVSFKESTKPTLVRSVRGRDVPLSGRACIDANGGVWSTRIDLDGRYTTRGVVEVTYSPHDRVDVLVPDRMWEWYVLPETDREGLPLFVEAVASYSNLRQFTVTTGEQVK